jgi:hypothetical protein
MTTGMAAEEQRRVRSLWLAPLALYALIFACFTAPLLERFSTHFFADAGDGVVNVWNLWWIDTAVTRLRTQPWWTTHLHFPHGTSLLGHTLNPFNGFLGILLQPWLGLVRTHNVIVVFAFVVGAYAAFRLALHVTERYVGSLIAGFVFGFSSFHFAHAIGHLNLVSLEWIPLFFLAWLRLFERPSLARGAQAALALFLVLLCDHYYFLYCVLGGALLLLVQMVQRRDLLFWLRPPFIGPMASFVAVSVFSSGALVVPLLWLADRDPLSGVHSARYYSMDLMSLWIPGGNWRFGELTMGFWSRLVGEPVTESSVSLGFAATLAIFVTWRQRARFRALDLAPWWALLAFFPVMSLGPLLQVWGVTLPVVLPYRLLEILLPPLELSGCPVRMVVMVTLAAGILAGVGIDELLRRGRGARAGAVLLVLVMGIELLPRQIPTTAVGPLPGWVPALAALPERYGFMDVEGVVVGPPALYFQTIHHVPMFEGYMARTPASALQRDAALRILRRRGNFRSLCIEHGFAYFLFPRGGAGSMPNAPIWSGEDLELYDVRSAWACADTRSR